MKRIIIIGSFAATAFFALTGNMQAQSSIDQVLKNIETNNKELQANGQLIQSQNWKLKRIIICRILHFPMRIFGGRRIRVRQSVNWLFHRASIFRVYT